MRQLTERTALASGSATAAVGLRIPIGVIGAGCLSAKSGPSGSAQRIQPLERGTRAVVTLRCARNRAVRAPQAGWSGAGGAGNGISRERLFPAGAGRAR